MILCLAGSLVKKVFPIISVIALLLLFVVFAIKKTKITPVLKNILSQKNIIFLIPLLYLNFQLWGVNLVKYKTLMPSCEQITSHETCLQNQLYNRNFKLREKAQSTKKRMNVSDYLSFFQNRMLSTIYGIFAHKSIVRKNQDLTFYKLIFSIATISFIRKIKPKKNLVDLILFLYSFFFVSSMILVIRSVYAWSNVPDLGAQGRYLFPIIIPFYYLVSKYLLLITNNKIIKFSIFLIVACYFIGNSFPCFIKNITPGWFQ